MAIQTDEGSSFDRIKMEEVQREIKAAKAHLRKTLKVYDRMIEGVYLWPYERGITLQIIYYLGAWTGPRQAYNVSL